jgi:N-acylneuraminate cytidylyltransferase
VFTDNRVVVHQDGTEAVLCHRGDGLGLAALKASETGVLILSTERNPVVSARAAKLQLECRQDAEPKVDTLLGILRDRAIDPGEVVYVGNDVNDLGCLRAVGCAVAVADAHPEVLAAAQIVLAHRGGEGAVREVADLVLMRDRLL